MSGGVFAVACPLCGAAPEKPCIEPLTRKVRRTSHEMRIAAAKTVAAAPSKRATLSCACPTCMVGPGEKCTAPTNDGRREVNWTHYARQAEAAAAAEVPEESIVPAAQQEPRFLVLKEDGGVLLFDEMREAEAVGIVEHGAIYRLALHQDYRD